jgi:hypothetical protein
VIASVVEAIVKEVEVSMDELWLTKVAESATLKDSTRLSMALILVLMSSRSTRTDALSRFSAGAATLAVAPAVMARRVENFILAEFQRVRVTQANVEMK